jgi:hypothetical protein
MRPHQTGELLQIAAQNTANTLLIVRAPFFHSII